MPFTRLRRIRGSTQIPLRIHRSTRHLHTLFISLSLSLYIYLYIYIFVFIVGNVDNPGFPFLRFSLVTENDAANSSAEPNFLLIIINYPMMNITWSVLLIIDASHLYFYEMNTSYVRMNLL